MNLPELATTSTKFRVGDKVKLKDPSWHRRVTVQPVVGKVVSVDGGVGCVVKWPTEMAVVFHVDRELVRLWWKD